MQRRLWEEDRRPGGGRRRRRGVKGWWGRGEGQALQGSEREGRPAAAAARAHLIPAAPLSSSAGSEGVTPSLPPLRARRPRPAGPTLAPQMTSAEDCDEQAMRCDAALQPHFPPPPFPPASSPRPVGWAGLARRRRLSGERRRASPSSRAGRGARAASASLDRIESMAEPSAEGGRVMQ